VVEKLLGHAMVEALVINKVLRRTIHLLLAPNSLCTGLIFAPLAGAGRMALSFQVVTDITTLPNVFFFLFYSLGFLHILNLIVVRHFVPSFLCFLSPQLVSANEKSKLLFLEAPKKQEGR